MTGQTKGHCRRIKACRRQRARAALFYVFARVIISVVRPIIVLHYYSLVSHLFLERCIFGHPRQPHKLLHCPICHTWSSYACIETALSLCCKKRSFPHFVILISWETSNLRWTKPHSKVQASYMRSLHIDGTFPILLCHVVSLSVPAVNKTRGNIQDLCFVVWKQSSLTYSVTTLSLSTHTIAL